MKKLLLYSVLHLALVSVFLVSVAAMPDYAGNESASCVFVSLKDSGWISRNDSGIKRTLNLGDVLKMSDKVLVMHGNRVQLALDHQCKNMIQVEEGSSFTLSSVSPVRISLEKGKIFSLLDDLPSGSQFTVETPTAVVVLLGTQCQINTNGVESNILVYRGLVEVRGRTLDGDVTEAVFLTAGSKTSVTEVGQAPKSAVKMNDKENQEIAAVLENAENTRQNLEPTQVQSWISEKPSSSTFRNDPASESSDEKIKSGKRLVVLL